MFESIFSGRRCPDRFGWRGNRDRSRIGGSELGTTRNRPAQFRIDPSAIRPSGFGKTVGADTPSNTHTSTDSLTSTRADASADGDSTAAALGATDSERGPNAAAAAADAPANGHATADPFTPTVANPSADRDTTAAAHATSHADPGPDSTNLHATADGHSATCAHAAAHRDSPGDADAVQFDVTVNRHAIAHVGRCLLGRPAIGGAGGYTDRCRHRLGL